MRAMRLLLRLGSFMRPYASRMVTASILLAFAGGLMSLVIASMKPLVDLVLLAPARDQGEAGGGGGTSSLLASLGDWMPVESWSRWLAGHAFAAVPILLIVIFVLRGVVLYGGKYMTSKVGAMMIRDIRAALHASICTQSLSFFKDHPTGELMSRVFGDVQRLQRLSTEVLADLVRVSTMIPFLLAVVIIHDWRMSLFTMVVVPVVIYPFAKLGRRLRRAATRAQESIAQATSQFGETTRGIMVVQGFGMERFVVARFGQALGRLLRAELQSARAASLAGPVMEVVGAFAGALLIYLAGWSISRGRVDSGDMVVVLGGMGMLFMSMRRLTQINASVQQALAAAERVFAILDRQPDIRDLPQARPMTGFHGDIRFEAVSFSYGGEQVLKGIDITIRQGERVALVGPSGAGKTTLANLLPRFYDPTAGRVSMNGVDLREVTLASLRANIGIVTQETLLFDDTVRNNIAFGRADIPLEKVMEAARAAHVHEFVTAQPDGYDAMIGEGGGRLSMGQRQRIAIARALLKDPPILILDEATSSLDAESEHLVQEALETLLLGRTSLVIAHRLSTVRNADRILVMDRGQVVEEGRHEDLLARGGLYARLHELQFRDAKPE